MTEQEYLCPEIVKNQSVFQKWWNIFSFIAFWVAFYFVLNFLVTNQWLPEHSQLNIIIFIVSFILALLLNIFILNKIDNDNQTQDLDNAKEIIFKRDVRLKEAVCELKKTFKGFTCSLDEKPEKNLLTDEQIFFLSSTDLFVEKAQAVLTRRGKFLIRAGIVTMVGAFFLLTLGFVFAIIGQNTRVQNYFGYLAETFIPNNTTAQTSQNTPTTNPNSIEEYLETPVYYPQYTKHPQYKELRKYEPQIGWQLLIYSLFKTLGITAYIYVSVKLLISLSRSFFHEGLSLFERRHALRFGRMYLYLKKGEVSEKWLETFFQWNKETKTSFLDMKPEVVTETLLHKLFGVFSDAGHAAKNAKINTGF